MFNAQSKIDEIGETTDPALLIELDDLRDARDAYMVSAIGFVFLGMFGVFVLSERSVPAKLSESQMQGSAHMAHDFLAGLVREIVGDGVSETELHRCVHKVADEIGRAHV